MADMPSESYTDAGEKPPSQYNPTHTLVVPAVPASAPIIADFLGRCALLDLEVHSARESDYVVAVAW